jgi:two-component system, NarL family, sensor histidine kinase UhpB
MRAPTQPLAFTGMLVQAPARRHIPLFWRLFVPNAAVLTAACVVLIIQPANGRVVALAGGLLVMLVTNLFLMRRAFAPLTRLATVMRTVDPLHPGHRIPVEGPDSEVTVLAESFNDMLDRLETERRESARREVAAQEAERRHVAAELHDQIGQTLTALAMQLNRAGERSPAELRPELDEARATAATTVEDVRRLARRLRPEVLDALGLVAALTNLCERLAEQTRVRIVPELGRDLPILSPEAQLVVYRVAQESLTNVVRHASASRAVVRLRRDTDHVTLEVADDGVGLDAAGHHVRGSGIRGMRERALLVGAELRLGRAGEGGTVVRLRVPAESEELR